MLSGHFCSERLFLCFLTACQICQSADRASRRARLHLPTEICLRFPQPLRRRVRPQQKQVVVAEPAASIADDGDDGGVVAVAVAVVFAAVAVAVVAAVAVSVVFAVVFAVAVAAM